MKGHTLGIVTATFCFLPAFMSYLLWKAGDDAFESYIEMGYSVFFVLFGVFVLFVEFTA